ncbi:hypothetical protein CEXT_566441 [Caerostris extrusa]|uniref:Uncharacterized protein n=1 Tax=Caerostris extrusa TaxID=172846 RepID=A0AAV4UMH1_CAEEX|nr:hypothetical protein CEXT_566441 [Caerostris extrusa]
MRALRLTESKYRKRLIFHFLENSVKKADKVGQISAQKNSLHKTRLINGIQKSSILLRILSYLTSISRGRIDSIDCCGSRIQEKNDRVEYFSEWVLFQLFVVLGIECRIIDP